MATQSETRPWWQKGPHSAGPHSPGDGSEGPNASGRARAREGSAPTAQSQADSAAKSAVTDGDETGVEAIDWAAVRDEWAARLARLRREFTPPDFIHHDRPSLAKGWAYADRGEWTTKDGALRTAGRVYVLVAAVPRAGLLYIDWIIERPSRLIAAGVLLVLLLSWLT